MPSKDILPKLLRDVSVIGFYSRNVFNISACHSTLNLRDGLEGKDFHLTYTMLKAKTTFYRFLIKNLV